MIDFLFSDKVEKLLVWACAILFSILCWVQVFHWLDNSTKKTLDVMRTDILEMKFMVQKSIEQYEMLKERGE